MTITHTQVNIIIALLSIIAFCVGTFLAQDWYYSFRAWRQQRAAERERLDRECRVRLDRATTPGEYFRLREKLERLTRKDAQTK